MRRWIWLALAASLAAGTAQAADPFLVGVIAPASGPMAMVGTRQSSAIEWWANEVNAGGGIRGRAVKLATCDDQGNPERAVTCTRDLIGQGALFLLNLSIIGPVRATVPLVKNGPVEIVATPVLQPEPDSFVFQIMPTDSEVTRALLLYAQANQVKRFGMLATTDASGETAVAEVQNLFPPAGIAVTLQRLDLRANDASIQLANIAKENPQLIYASFVGAGAAAVVKSYNNLGLTIPLLVAESNVTDAFLNVIKGDVPPRLLGMSLRSIVPALVTDPDNRARAEHFNTSYLAWKKQPADQLNHLGLLLADCADAVLRGVDNPGDARAVRGFLEKTPIKSIQTMHYSATSHIGLRADSLAVVEYKAGRWDKADPLK